MAIKYRHITGVDEALSKLERLKYSIAERAIELLFYLTAAVHFDFVYKIAKGQVKDKFLLTPNSICYLLDMKWEEVGHNKLFMLTGGYAKSIQILNVATVKDALKPSQIVTMVIGINDSEKLNIAHILEEGGDASTGKGIIPPRPLWEKYAKYVRGILKSAKLEQGIKKLEKSHWADEFSRLLKDFEKNLSTDIKRKTHIDIRTKRDKEESELIQFVERENVKDYMNPMDLLDVALGQQYRFSVKTWERIVRKFKEYMKTSRHSFPIETISTSLDKSLEEKRMEFETTIESGYIEEPEEGEEDYEWESPDFW